MSKQEKSKKLRKPNVYMGAGTSAPAAAESAAGGGAESTPVIVSRAPSTPTRTAEPAAVKVNFDYSHIKRDLTRIGILAGSFFAILVVLSFFIK